MIRIPHCTDARIFYESAAATVRDAVEEAVRSGVRLDGANLARANLRGADLSGASFYGADSSFASLDGARLDGADLRRACLVDADLRHARLVGAHLAGACLAGAHLAGACLDGASLAGATMPDGRTWEAYRADHLAGLCDAPEVRKRAFQARGSHDWGSCPMSAAHGWRQFEDAPADKHLLVGCWVACFDGKLFGDVGWGI